MKYQKDLAAAMIAQTLMADLSPQPLTQMRIPSKPSEKNRDKVKLARKQKQRRKG